MAEEEIKYSYDMDYFVKWSYTKTYEVYDRLSWKQLDISKISPERLAEIEAHAAAYWVSTDEKTFYEEIKETQERWESPIIYNPHKK